jgi:hypothetical protein
LSFGHRRRDVVESLEQPPFPPLTWEDYFWVAELTLPSWAGFQVRHGADRDAHDPSPADGTAQLSISAADSDARTPPTAEQVAAFRHLLDNEAAIADAVASALVRYCPGDAYDGDDEVLWEVSGVDDLRQLVRLIGVHMITVARDGAACVGFEFACAWDYEHGAGVMTHLGRVVATGQGVCSFEAWIARQGLDRYPRQAEPGAAADGGRDPGSS